MPRKLVIRSADSIAKKWGDVTPGRSAFYEAGIASPLRDWETETVNAQARFKSAVQAANIDKLYAGGVKMAGTSKWQRKAKAVGVSRFGPGVSAAVSDYKDKFAPYAETINTLEVPDRGPRGSDANWEISKKVGKTLAEKRLALRAAGT